MSRRFEPKARLRAQLLSVRRGLSPARRLEASRRVCGELLALAEVRRARVVLAHMPMGTEVDIEPALRALVSAGTSLLLPWVAGETLEVGRVEDLDVDLGPGWRAVREPLQRVPELPAEADVALVPGVAFDRSGNRLGYGGGHFDRLLARLAPETPIIAPAFAVQVVDRLPHEPHDIAVQLIVTEEGLHRIS